MSASNSRLNFYQNITKRNFFSFFFLEMATDTDGIVQVWSHSTNQINANKTVTLNFKSQWIFNWNFFPMNLIKNWSDQATVYRLFTLCCPINSLWKSQSLFKSDLPFNLHILIINSTKEKQTGWFQIQGIKIDSLVTYIYLSLDNVFPRGTFIQEYIFSAPPAPNPLVFNVMPENHEQTKWHHWL